VGRSTADGPPSDDAITGLGQGGRHVSRKISVAALAPCTYTVRDIALGVGGSSETNHE